MDKTNLIIQDTLNALNVKARLLKAWADREKVNELIKKYEELIHPLIYEKCNTQSTK